MSVAFDLALIPTFDVNRTVIQATHGLGIRRPPDERSAGRARLIGNQTLGPTYWIAFCKQSVRETVRSVAGNDNLYTRHPRKVPTLGQTRDASAPHNDLYMQTHTLDELLVVASPGRIPLLDLGNPESGMSLVPSQPIAPVPL